MDQKWENYGPSKIGWSKSRKWKSQNIWKVDNLDDQTFFEC